MFSQKELSSIKSAAKSNGAKRYFGNLCLDHPEKYGERAVRNGGCVECCRVKVNPERRRQNDRARYAADPQRFLDTHARYRARPEAKERIAPQKKAWSEANRPRRAERQRARVARQNASRMALLHREASLVIYDDAARVTKETGVPHEVDHVVPLQAVGVCGLHVPWNLRVDTAEANRRKQNRWTETDALPAWPHALDLRRN
jgi:5-methylcytosine-specific restriction endonuclease McrA